MLLPPTIPLFPLPNVVLFPNVFLPLHIFEPRYREMVGDALDEDRLIGMALLRPGWQNDYEGRPPVYPIGCAGLITHAERLGDGGYNIILRGLEKFRILDEVREDRSYRRAHVEPLHEAMDETARGAIRDDRHRLESLIALHGEGGRPDLRIPAAMGDEDLVNALAQYLPLEPLEKQALLEQQGLVARCRSLIELLEMKVLVAKTAARSEWSH
jgi:Lon protease-like protein